MKIYNLNILLSQFWTSPFFHVQFCCFLTCIQISQEAGKEVWYSHLFRNFPQFDVIHIVKGFSKVNEAELFLEFSCFFFFFFQNVFLEFSCFFYDPMDGCNLISGTSAFLNPVCISGSSRSMYSWILENFEQYFVSLLIECNCVVVWTFFGIAFLWYGNENWPFSVLRPLLSFPNLLVYCVLI